MLKSTNSTEEPILQTAGLCRYFNMGRSNMVKAVDNVSFSIKKGETLGLVGESGCGKTTCGRTSIGLYEKTSGSSYFYGKDIAGLKGKEKKDFTKRVQMIFQDPYNSLDPRMKIDRIISENLRIHGMTRSRKEEQEIVREMLHKVGLHQDYARRSVREFSGGQRQRIGIARALAAEPEFILCDEPISALDVSVQAQIMNLMIEFKEKMGLTYLFISHNLAAVKYISDYIAIMYFGKIVEMGDVQEIYSHPLHPYTQALISAIPIPDPDIEKKRTKVLLSDRSGTALSLIGCRFASRCPYVSDRCMEKEPELKTVSPGHQLACCHGEH